MGTGMMGGMGGIQEPKSVAHTFFFNMYKAENRTDGGSRRHRNTDKTW